MKKWIMNLSSLFKTLGFSKEKIQGGLTAAEWKQVRESYLATYGTSLESDKALNEDVPQNEPEALSLTAEETAALADALGVNQEEVPDDAKAAAKKAAEIAAQKAAEAQRLAEEKARLAATPENELPADRVRAKQQLLPLAGHHTKGYLFGVEHELYSRKKWYNELMANPAHTLVQVTETDAEIFSKDLKAQTKALRERMDYHRANGTFDQLDFTAASGGQPETLLDYLDMMPGYMTRRTDLVLAYFKSLPSVKDLFPVRSNVQNREVAVGAIVGELSQSYIKGRIFKGGIEFEADLYKVDDVMFKYNFEDLVDLEKQYIGYLNKDHSAIIKWTFIEWVMIHYGEQLIKEQNERNVIGIRLPLQNVQNSPSNFAADGVIHAIARACQQYRVLPFYNIGLYTAATMLDTVEAFADAVQEAAGSAADSMKIYLNARHKRWYIRAYREKYGQDADFTGSHATLVDLDPAKLVWVPNMRANDFYIWATEPGNIELLEDKPGEMLAFNFKEELEGVAVVSRWKEGAHVQKAGKSFSTAAKLEADQYKHQFLFINFPVGSTPSESSLVDATLALGSLTPGLYTFYMVNTGDETAYRLDPGQVGVLYPVLAEEDGETYAQRWNMMRNIGSPFTVDVCDPLLTN